ncbi:glycosyltransferase [Desulfovibrio litoralis]|uniref:Glycosyl transferases group 1 n=1 Tax=Desulfovibrio litoralis DSM 11393 TaxID=1121455 RepID=A0A1M7TQF5_9BACT|nr:glycosyltransferase [Desulfovibrio litoralis]SHN72969.1 Glycosyl transferases group 1 [Desulfovibrio litoralis DSM 11393]
MAELNIYYHLSSYISHKKAGLAYKSCIQNLSRLVRGGDFSFTLVDNPKLANLAIIHDEPNNIPHILKQYPPLKKIPKIVYGVWETDILPQAFIAGLESCIEVWTCSKFSQKAFLQSGKECFVIPHLVKRTPPTPEALAKIKQLLFSQGVSSDSFLFFSIVDIINPRKNTTALLKAFCSQTKKWGNKVKLVLKQYRQIQDLSSFPNIISISDELSEEEISALHNLTHCYVSPHCSEAWGLGLSEAMSFAKPVIATNYSGNLEFMNPDNSILVDYELENIPLEMCRLLPLFTPKMHWAKINVDELAVKMNMVCSNAMAMLPAKENISNITKLFSQETIGVLIFSRLKAVCEKYKLG